jgi:hypothetical protein
MMGEPGMSSVIVTNMMAIEELACWWLWYNLDSHKLVSWRARILPQDSEFGRKESMGMRNMAPIGGIIPS